MVDASAYGAVPTAPAAVPVTDVEPRCWRCRRKVAFLATRPWRIQCSRCKTVNNAPGGPDPAAAAPSS